MKRSIKSIFSFLIASVLMLTGCAKFADGTSVWGGGLWIIPTATTIGALIFGYQAYVASRSGSVKQSKETGEIIDQGKNVPIYKIGKFYFAVALIVATLLITCNVANNR